MIRRAVIVVAVVAPLAYSALTRAQSGPDDLWEITTKVTMEGMSMPAMPSKVCRKRGETVPPVEQNCKTQDIKQVGNRTTYRVVCTGKDAMSGTGEVIQGNGTMRGTLKLSGKVDGEDSTMLNEYSGKLVGRCTAG